MIAEKKRKAKKTTPGEPNSRFYVRRWDATDSEQSEIRAFIRAKKHRKNPKSSAVNKSSAKKIREKIVR